MNRDKKNKNVNSYRHGGVKQASGRHGVLRWAQIVFFPDSTDITRHTSPKRFLHQKIEKTRFYKSLRRASEKKNGKNIILRPEIAERHGNAICSQSAFFIKKMKKRVFTKASRERDDKKVGIVGKTGCIETRRYKTLPKQYEKNGNSPKITLL